MLSAARIQEIEDLSSGVLFDYYRTHHTTLPIEVVEVADSYGLIVVKAEFEDDGISGCFEPAASKIWVSVRDSLARQRFTIAHEMGHHLLHRDRGRDVLYRRDLDQPDAAESLIEKEANWFAAALLMPEHCVARFSVKNPDVLKKKFEVSHSAMKFRLKNLSSSL